MSPTEAGLMSIAMVGGLLVSSTVSGRIITNTGYWKRFLVGGMVLVIIGMSLLGTIDAETPLPVVGGYMLVVGLGIGATMQNLVLAVQNTADPRDLGAASSVVAFFRSMGGSIGVSALGAVLAHQVSGSVKDGIAQLVAGGRLTPAEIAQLQHSTGDIPDLDALPGPVQTVYEAAMGDATGHLFLIAVPFVIAAFVCVLFIKETPLRTNLGPAEAAAPEATGDLDEMAAEPATREARTR
jgi:MFS family permease